MIGSALLNDELDEISVGRISKKTLTCKRKGQPHRRSIWLLQRLIMRHAGTRCGNRT